jgi:beta-lactamase superfamily II metal-dependent hydrolase
MMVTTDGESLDTIAGIPDCAEGATVAALDVGSELLVDLAHPTAASAPSTTTMSHPVVRRAVISYLQSRG